MNDDDKIVVILCGRRLGTTTGWDGDPGDLIWFYDFVPVDGIGLRKTKTLHVDYNKGYISYETESSVQVDIPTLLAAIPRDPSCP